MIYDFSAPLFWYKLIFAAELISAECLAAYTLKKKNKFALRMLAATLAVFAVAFACPIIVYNAIYSSFIFFIIFIASLVAMKFCLNEPWQNVFFCGLVSYTTQHLAYESFNWFCNVSDIGNFIAVYDGQSEFELNGFMILAYAVIYLILYWFMWAFVERKIRTNSNGDMRLENMRILFISAVIILVDIILNSITVFTTIKLDKLINTVIYLYSLISSALCIWLLFSLLDVKTAQSELKTVQAMWREDKRMYELSKQNVELINIKCHDLKKQLRFLRKQEGEVKREALKEIEQAINFYDSAVETGNAVLDLIMADRGLYCSQHNINLTCMADGKQLNFISEVDLYSMLINAVDNAIEAVEKYDEAEKRFIRLKVATKNEFVSVRVENWLENAEGIKLKDGLPETSKQDKDNHGFGLKSIKLIAEKYNGSLAVSTEIKNLFSLNILIPLPNGVIDEKQTQIKQ